MFRAPSSLYTTTSDHYGSRFLFDGKGHLFFSIGERHNMVNAQSLATPLGKIHRINEDGSIPADNPFVNLPDAVPSIWSLGHRNPEGLAFDPVTGDLWESEHGPAGGDEINVIDKGHNYGWGLASMGLEPGILSQSAPNTDPPITFYTPRHRAQRHQLLQRRPISGLEERPVRQPRWRDRNCCGLETKGRQIVAQEVPVQGIRPGARCDHGTGWIALCPAAKSHRRGHRLAAFGVHYGHGDPPGADAMRHYGMDSP